MRDRLRLRSAWLALLARGQRRARARRSACATTPASTVKLAAPAQRIVSLAPHATELLFAAGAGRASSASLDTSDWPAAAKSMPRVGDVARARPRAHRRARARISSSRGRTRRRRRSTRCARAASPCSSTDPATIDGIAADHRAAGRARRRRGRAAARGGRFRAHGSRDCASAHARRRRSACSTRSGTRRCTRSAASTSSRRRSRVCGGENVFAALTLPAPAVERRGGARGEAGGDRRRRRRRACARVARRLEALAGAARGRATDHLFVVDADLLHRAGPRFVDGVAALCAALDARALTSVTARIRFRPAGTQRARRGRRRRRRADGRRAPTARRAVSTSAAGPRDARPPPSAIA